MDFTFSKKERRLLQLAENIVEEWKAILHLDPLWTIHIDVFDDIDNPGALARVDASNTEYYVATIELSYSLFEFKEKQFVLKMNEIACHELLHLATVDFFRTAQLAAAENEEMLKELRYKYEQFTARLQKAFVEMFNSNIELEVKLRTIKNLYLSEDHPKKWKDLNKLLDLSEEQQEENE